MKKITLLGFIITFAVLANAAGQFSYMGYEGVTYDDNIYLTNKNKKDSFINTTRVGVNYVGQIPNSSLKLDAGAVGGYHFYTEDNDKNAYADAAANVELYNDNFTLGDKFLFTSDPANSELTQRAKRLNNNAYVSYVTSKEKMFGVGVKISDVFDRYFKAKWEALNRNRVNLGAALYYNMSSKTSFLAEYTFTDIDYKVNNDNNSNGGTVALGVEGQIAPKVKGTAKATYTYRNYKHDLAGYKNYADLFGYDVALSWQPTTRNEIRLSGDRTFDETVYTNNRYFISTGINLYASQKIKDKFTIALTLGYDNLAYETRVYGIKRSDDVYRIKPEVNYQFKEWLSAGVWYQYRKRNSNLSDELDYANNKAGVFVKAVF
jgi:Uncharacterized protein conserved in bacteria (DUF2320).